jgi:hypothetical protein
MMNGTGRAGKQEAELRQGLGEQGGEERLFWAGRFLSREKYLQIPTFLRWGRIPVSLRPRG